MLILHGFEVVAHALGRVFVKLTPSDDVESLRRGVVQKIGRFFMHLEVSLKVLRACTYNNFPVF